MNKTLFLLSLLITPVAYSQEPKDLMKNILGISLELAQMIWIIVFVLCLFMFTITYIFAKQNKTLLVLLGFLIILALFVRFIFLKG